MKNIVFLIFILCCSFANAGISTYSRELHGSALASLSTPNGQMTIVDDFWSNSNNNCLGSFSNYKVKNLIKFHFTGQLHKNYGTSWSSQVILTYVGYDENGSVSSPNVCTLSVNYSATAAYKDIDIKEFSNFHKVVISNVSFQNIGITVLPEDLYLEQIMEVERYFDFSTAQIPNIEAVFSPDNYKLNLSWNFIQGAEEYELEWCFISNELVNSINYVDIANHRFTRVTLTGNSYTLNMVYEPGKLYYRVRAIGRQGSDYSFPIYGSYSDQGNASGEYVNTTDLLLINPNNDPSKNWGYNVAYSEDGLKVETLSFYDGSGRNRQTVTLNNSEDVAIIGEAYYDYEGRSSIGALPSPTKTFDNQLTFYPEFTFGGNGELFNKSYYSADPQVNNCTSQDIIMADEGTFANADGPSVYYSEQNTTDQYNRGINGNIPNAFEYPFTRTIYNRDGSVFQQSGIGQNHRIGSGHEVTAYHASPTQERLDRLFGNHSGVSSHYTVTLVEDANGQINAAYKNATGQVVATSLIGQSPSSLTPLESNSINPNFKESFTNSNLFDPITNSWKITKSIMVYSPGSYDFEYVLSKENYEGLCGLPDGSCIYDLQIDIIDRCNNSPTESNGQHNSNSKVILSTTHLLSSNNLNETLTFSIYFPEPGVYYLEKTLKINEAALETALTEYEQHLRSQENTCFTLEEFDVDYSPCSSCQTCEITYNYNANCETLLQIIQADMSPGGQYFDNLENGSNFNQATANNWLINRLGFSTPSNAGIVGFSSWDDLRTNWPSDPTTILGILAPYHPEYCNYLKCIELVNSGSTGFDWNFASTVSYSNANSNGWLGGTPVGIDLINSSNPGVFDPAVTHFSTNSPSFGTFMSNIITTGITGTPGNTLWDDALDIANLNGCTSCNDDAWQIFKLEYLSQKQLYFNQVAFPTCTPLCNNTNPPDQFADGCSAFNQAREILADGFIIRDPGINYSEFDSQSELSNAEEVLTEEANNCYATVILNASTINLTENCPYTISIGNNPNDLIVISLGIDFCAPLLSCETKANLIALAINSAVTSPDAVAVVDGCNVKIIINSSSIPGDIDICNSPSNNIYLVDKNNGISDVGNLTCNCSDDLLSCFGNELQLNFSGLLQQNEGASNQDIYDQMAQYYFNYYPSLNTEYSTPSLLAADIAQWMINVNTNPNQAPCLDGTSSCIPAILLENCNMLPLGCNPNEESESLANYNSNTTFELNIALALLEFKTQYIQKCLNGDSYKESFQMTGADHEYHYTLYFYDNVGNLTKTIPPKGVHVLSPAETELVQAHRENPLTNPFVQPGHTFVSSYTYNSFNQVLTSDMPDMTNILTFSESPQTSIGFVIGKIQMQSETIGIAVGSDLAGTSGLIKLTTDGGQTWTNASIPSGTPVLISSAFVSNTEGYAVGYGGTILKTLDGGFTWTTLASGTTNDLYAIEFVSATKAFLVGNSNTLLRLESGVIYSMTAPVSGNFRTIAFDNNNYAFVGGANASFFKINTTTNATATITAPAASPVNFQSILISNNGRVLVGGATSGSERIFFGTIDFANGTIAWDNQYAFSGSTGNIKDITTHGFGLYFAASTGGNLYYSTDDGYSWNLQTLSTGTQSNYSFATTPSGNTVLAGYDHFTDFVIESWDNRFFYDDLGRVKASQNSKQKGYSPISAYSYFSYDNLGRVIEAGEVNLNNPPISTELNDNNWPSVWIGAAIRYEITHTHYDDALVGLVAPFENGQQNLRNRVATTTFKRSSNFSDYEFASHYSYDIHGNVNELIQENKNLEEIGQHFKTLVYQYDLISGNVKKVTYQKDQLDQFVHQYYYDANNRLVKVETSRDENIWEKEAKYYYYLHGPLARTEVGDKSVQGLDIAYTIQGWLKGVNSNWLDASKELGKDGAIGLDHYFNTASIGINNVHRNVAQDAFGFTLSYFGDSGTNFSNDYEAIGGTSKDLFWNDINTLSSSGNNLFNGNIRNMSTALMDINENKMDRAIGVYQYDQLNRLKSMAWMSTTSSSSFIGVTNTTVNDETYTYDANGNILALSRYGINGTQMDELKYSYSNSNNRLQSVNDLTSTSSFVTDIEGLHNYTYDALGNLVTDQSEEIDNIIWNLRGKVSKIIRKANSNKPELEFLYDSFGRRVGKIVKPRSGGNTQGELHWTYTWYIYDASGKVLATYENTYSQPFGEDPDTYSEQIKLKELEIWGASRLGVDNDNSTVFFCTFSDPGYSQVNPQEFTEKQNLSILSFSQEQIGLNSRILGKKKYQLSNHLGNVLSVVTDRPIGVDFHYFVQDIVSGTYNYSSSSNEYHYVGSGGSFLPTIGTDNTYDFYLADVVSVSDYYPFGMVMEGRSGNSGNQYRYGFQNQEKDNEIKGDGNSINFEYRMHDPRIGRFMAVDPLITKYPQWTPYSFSGNMVIQFIELEGLEPVAPTSFNYFLQGTCNDLGLTINEAEYIAYEANHGNWMPLIHLTLDIVGFIPIIGEPADFTNGTIYLFEGRYAEAGLCYAAMIPVYGSMATGIKWAKYGAFATKITKTGGFVAFFATKADALYASAAVTSYRLTSNMKKAGKYLGAQAHHIIPLEIIKRNPAVAKLIERGLWDPHKALNGISLPAGFHTKHPAYTDYVSDKITKYIDKYGESGLLNYLDNKLIPELETIINVALKKYKEEGGASLNEFFKELLKNENNIQK